MVLFTGDTHGDVTRIVHAIHRFALRKDDVIVILGDVGLNYYGNDRGDRDRKKKLNSKGVPILCIHGNHERRPATLKTYKAIEWHGGKVYVEEGLPNLLFAIDGEVYDLDGQKAIAIGGAYSVDKFYRLARGYSWFPDEQPDEETKARVEAKWPPWTGRLTWCFLILARRVTYQLRPFCQAWTNLLSTIAPRSGWIPLRTDWLMVIGSAVIGTSIKDWNTSVS